MALLIDDGYWIGIGGIFSVQVTRSVFYIAFFGLGAAAQKRKWLEAAGFFKPGPLYLAAAIVLSAALIVFRLYAGDLADAGRTLANAFLHAFTCLAWLLALLFVFSRGRAGEGKFWRFMASHSFRIYFIHMLPVIGLQLLLSGIDLPVFLKVPLVFAAGLGASLAVSVAVGGGRRLAAAALSGKRLVKKSPGKSFGK